MFWNYFCYYLLNDYLVNQNFVCVSGATYLSWILSIQTFNNHNHSNVLATINSVSLYSIVSESIILPCCNLSLPLLDKMNWHSPYIHHGKNNRLHKYPPLLLAIWSSRCKFYHPCSNIQPDMDPWTKMKSFLTFHCPFLIQCDLYHTHY